MQNLNPWYAVLYRRANQWIRRKIIYRWHSPARQRLYDRKREIACQDVLTQEQKVELARINWKLGNGSYYHFTPEQRQLQVERTLAAIQQMRRDGRVD